MKSNAHTVTKDTFFQKANYLEPISYEEHFDNPIVEQENETIKKIMDIYIDSNIAITDIGCGSGLGRKLLPDNPYIGVDSSKKSIEFCSNNYKGAFFHADAEEYIDAVSKINPIFLFSMDYLSLEAIEKYILKTEKVFISVHLNRPYLSKTSVYSGQEDTYYELHPVEYLQGVQDLFKKYNATTFKLQNEEFYYVSVIQKV